MNNCIFCDIANIDGKASIVYQDEICTAFMDIKPVNPGHVLIIPNKHATYLEDLNPDIGSHIFKVAQRLSKSVRKSNVKSEGIDLFLADGEAAGQEVYHLHLHIIPRYKGDGFRFRFGPNYGNLPERSVLDELAQTIKRGL